jgi:hypothetical protein
VVASVTAWTSLIAMLLESMLVIAALLLVLSGGAKLADGGPTAGALRSARLPAGRPVVTGLALTEIIAGTSALIMSHPAAGLAVASLYVGFAGFVAWALRRDLPIQSCGCFGKRDTPPTPGHIVVNLTLAAAAAGAAGRPPLFDRFGTDILEASGVLFFGAIGTYLLYLMLAELPATMAAARAGRP